MSRCEGRYPVSQKREEPFDVTYRCGKESGHAGTHGLEELSVPEMSETIALLRLMMAAHAMDPRDRDLIERAAGVVDAALKTLSEKKELLKHMTKRALKAERAAEEAERKLNTPELHDFAKAVVLEAAHQRERWASDHDAGKSAKDWLWLVAYLVTKATQASRYGDGDKYPHHIITCAPACSNATGANAAMRPGVDPNKYAAIDEAREKPKDEEQIIISQEGIHWSQT